MVTVVLVVICLGVLAQAEEGAATNKAATASAGTATPSAAATAKSPATNTGKVASVNGTVISQEQFDRALAYQQEIAALQGVTITDEQMPELKYQLLESLIGTELLYQESQKSGIKIEEKEVNEAYETNKQKAQFKTDAEFEEALKQSNKTMTSYRAEIKQGLAVDHFIKGKFTDKTTVSDSEAKKYYDDYPAYFQQPARVRASHIMARFASSADQSKKDEARKKIEEAMKRIKSGDDFATVAKEISEDTSTRDNGGDLDYFSKGQLLQPIEDAAFALKIGEISDIVETGSGYHIVKLTDKKDAGKIGYEEVKNDIIDSLKTSKVNSAVSKYITVLKNKSTIITFPINK